MIVYRASELGSCVRALVARRKGERENETPEMVQGWYDRGNEHEVECITAMQADGWIVTDQQQEVMIPIADDVEVVGHLDGRCSRPFIPGADIYIPQNLVERVLEVKSPYSWQKWYDAHMTGDYSDPLMSRYAWQASTYCVAENAEMVVACVDEGVVKTFVIEIAPYSLKDIETRVLSIEWMAGTDTWPECNQRDFPCPFFPRVCSHAQDEVSFDPVLDGYATNYAEFKAMEKQAAESAAFLRDQILKHLDDRDTVTTDAYKVTRYTTKRTNRDYKAIKAAGIDLSPFERDTESVALKVTSREKDDAE